MWPVWSSTVAWMFQTVSSQVSKCKLGKSGMLPEPGVYSTRLVQPETQSSQRCWLRANRLSETVENNEMLTFRKKIKNSVRRIWKKNNRSHCSYNFCQSARLILTFPWQIRLTGQCLKSEIWLAEKIYIIHLDVLEAMQTKEIQFHWTNNGIWIVQVSPSDSF